MSVLTVLAWIVCFWIGWNLSKWKWSACTCGRTHSPYYFQKHEKEGIMWVIAGIDVMIALSLAAGSGSMVWAFIIGALGMWWARMAYMHGKGRRKLPKKVAGLVKINEHGKLVVE